MYSFLRNLPVLRAYLHDTIPYHVGSVWENRLGLQVLRTISRWIQFKLRNRRMTNDVNDCVRKLDEDGIAVIENFLEPSRFEEIRKEFDRAFEGSELQPYKNSENSNLYRNQISISKLSNSSSIISECFQHNAYLNSIAGSAVRRQISRPPDVHLDWYEGGDPSATDNDIENILHADLHTTTVKMFFYLEDADESNGAFIYAKGSHQMTVNRLRHEYELSIRQAKLRKGLPLEESLTEKRGKEIRNVIHPEHFKRMGVKETQMCVKANTLVIANNMGFHKRGEFPSSLPRKTIQINYRYLETPFGKSFLSRNTK